MITVTAIRVEVLPGTEFSAACLLIEQLSREHRNAPVSFDFNGKTYRTNRGSLNHARREQEAAFRRSYANR
jgi:hypothetical protein